MRALLFLRASPISQRELTAPQRLNGLAVIVIIDRFTVHWFIGFRAFLLAIPLGFWLLGQWWFLSASVVLVATLYNVDHSYAAWGL